MVNNQILRFTTAGSVDDGKSTLIGRLLFDSKSLYHDQFDQVKKISENKGFGNLDLSLFTDGLRDEREQGITIDVAYRYFNTSKRKFIIADTPGHIQYTRNMITGASTANLALILIDARKGVTEQTKRHSYIASLLNIPHIVVCINKMDLVNYNEKIFDDIVSVYEELSSKMINKDIRFIPISALEGDNVVNRSENMLWFQSSPLLHTLENIHIASDHNIIDTRFPIQTILRHSSKELLDYRAYLGRISSGILRHGDNVKVLPSGFTTKIKSINHNGRDVKEAASNMSIALTLEDEIDISRGDMIVKVNNSPIVTQDITATICWFSTKKYNSREKFIIRHNTNEQKAIMKKIIYKVDVNSSKRIEGQEDLLLNDIAKVEIRTTAPLMVDSYLKNRSNGGFVLIDEFTNDTIAAGIVLN